MIFFSFFLHISRNSVLMELCSKFIIINFSVHVHKVDDTYESIFGTDWKLDWHTVSV